MPAVEIARIRSLIKQLAQHGLKHAPPAVDFLQQFAHQACSSANRDLTKADSLTSARFLPLRTRVHSSTDSISTSETMTTRMPVTNASRRSLKIRRAVAPDACPAASCCAC